MIEYIFSVIHADSDTKYFPALNDVEKINNNVLRPKKSYVTHTSLCQNFFGGKGDFF